MRSSHSTCLLNDLPFSVFSYKIMKIKQIKHRFQQQLSALKREREVYAFKLFASSTALHTTQDARANELGFRFRGSDCDAKWRGNQRDKPQSRPEDTFWCLEIGCIGLSWTKGGGGTAPVGWAEKKSCSARSVSPRRTSGGYGGRIGWRS